MIIIDSIYGLSPERPLSDGDLVKFQEVKSRLTRRFATEVKLRVDAGQFKILLHHETHDSNRLSSGQRQIQGPDRPS